MERTRAVGLLLAVLSASAFGVMPVLTKVVYEGGTGALGVLSVRFTLAARPWSGWAPRTPPSSRRWSRW